MQCVSCYEFMTEGVCVCPNGHNACPGCKTARSGECPRCGERFLGADNVALHQLIQRTPLPCKNIGCKVKKIGEVYRFHKMECQMRLVTCVFSILGCAWRGRLTNIAQHISSQHGNLTRRWLNHGTVHTYVQHLHGNVFVVLVKTVNENQFVVALCAGPSTLINHKLYTATLHYPDKAHHGPSGPLMSIPIIRMCTIGQAFDGVKAVMPMDMFKNLKCKVRHIKVKILLK